MLHVWRVRHTAAEEEGARCHLVHAPPPHMRDACGARSPRAHAATRRIENAQKTWRRCMCETSRQGVPPYSVAAWPTRRTGGARTKRDGGTRRNGLRLCLLYSFTPSQDSIVEYAMNFCLQYYNCYILYSTSFFLIKNCSLCLRIYKKFTNLRIRTLYVLTHLVSHVRVKLMSRLNVRWNANISFPS